MKVDGVVDDGTWLVDHRRRLDRAEAEWLSGWPARLDLHCIVDNIKTHDTDLVHQFLTDHPHVHSLLLTPAG